MNRQYYKFNNFNYTLLYIFNQSLYKYHKICYHKKSKHNFLRHLNKIHPYNHSQALNFCLYCLYILYKYLIYHMIYIQENTIYKFYFLQIVLFYIYTNYFLVFYHQNMLSKNHQYYKFYKYTYKLYILMNHFHNIYHHINKGVVYDYYHYNLNIHLKKNNLNKDFHI